MVEPAPPYHVIPELGAVGRQVLDALAVAAQVEFQSKV